MKNQYYHESLPSPRCIRVIHLDPSSDTESPLRCRVAVVALDDYSEHDAEYTALSYAWESQVPSCGMECDGRVLLVTPNCEAALRRLRRPDVAQALWVDSICINQSADAIDERNQQVAMMGEIYKNASCVAVWVGENDSRTDTAIQRLREIGTQPDDIGHENRRRYQRELRERVQRLASTVAKEDDDPIGPLFERSWFHRMWTVQEVTLSFLDRVVFCCGDVVLPWVQLILAVDVLIAEKYRWGRLAETMKLLRQLMINVSVSRYSGAREVLDDNPGDIRNTPLAFSILTNAREKSSSDPKDKIYALHGVLDELEVPFPAPDYRKSVEDIYRESVVACINYDKNLYVLYHVPSDHRRDGLASWVPDWSDAGWKDTDPRYGILRNRFAAGGPAISRWRFSADQNQLILTGKIIDSIIYRAEPLGLVGNILQSSLRMQDPAARDEFFRFCHLTYSVLRTWVEVGQWSDYPTNESAKEALQRTLINDNPEALADSAKDNSFDCWYNLMAASELEVIEMAFKSSQPGQPLPPLSAQREAFLRNWMDRIPEVQRSFKILEAASATGFHFSAVAFSHKKCFFSTENGYFGTAPDPLPVTVEAGDKIAVVAGLEMPLLLRPAEGGYRLLTHIYVHGIMCGEAWPDNEEALEDIVLV